MQSHITLVKKIVYTAVKNKYETFFRKFRHHINDTVVNLIISKSYCITYPLCHFKFEAAIIKIHAVTMLPQASEVAPYLKPGNKPMWPPIIISVMTLCGFVCYGVVAGINKLWDFFACKFFVPISRIYRAVKILTA